jgi:membrane-associated phospholipid phosphatase
MHQIKSFLKNLKSFDLVVVLFFSFLTILNLIFHNRVEQWLIFVCLNIFVILFVFLIVFLENKYEHKTWHIIHYWYIAPLILVTFKELYFMIKPIRQTDYDYLFIQIDRWLFGIDPTHFLYQFSHPIITEVLQIIYGMFYLLPLFLGLFLYSQKRYLAMDYAVFSIVYGFYLSYLGYFALPGIGPRFTLHDFSTINETLPGILLTNTLREIVNIGESIPAGTINPAAVVQRDVFPSGHTMITLLVMYLSVRLKSKSKYFFVPVGSLLIIATVYLWYHYVIDLIAGLIFLIFSVWSGKIIFNWWRRKTGNEEFEYDKV